MQKGVIFGVMALYIAILLIGLQDSGSSMDMAFRQAVTEKNALNGVWAKFDNVNTAIVRMPLWKAERESRENYVPFGYMADSNRVYFSQNIGDVNAADAYLETLNAAEVFIEHQNSSGMRVDINVPKPISWGGNAQSVRVLVNPQCLRYKYDGNLASVDFACQGVGMEDVKTLDVNLTINGGSDFSGISCNFAGGNSCPSDDYNSLAGLPYISVNILDANCPSCDLPQKIISGHFDPGVENFVRIECTAEQCLENPIDINFSSGMAVAYSGAGVGTLNTLIGFDLNSNINDAWLLDTNLAVRDTVFGIKRWN